MTAPSRWTLALATLGAGLVPTGKLPAQQATLASDSAVVASLEQQVEDAVVRQDTVFLARTYAPDFRFKHSTGDLQDRSTWLQVVAHTSFQVRRIDSLDVEVHGDVALCTGRLYVRRQSDDPRWREYTIRYARVYVRRSGRWLLLTHHSTGQTSGPPGP